MTGDEMVKKVQDEREAAKQALAAAEAVAEGIPDIPLGEHPHCAHHGPMIRRLVKGEIIMTHTLAAVSYVADFLGNGFTEQMELAVSSAAKAASESALLRARDIIAEAAKVAATEALKEAQTLWKKADRRTALPWTAYWQALGMEMVKRSPWMALVVVGIVLMRWGPSIVAPVARLFAVGN